MSPRLLLLTVLLAAPVASALGPFEENPPEVVRGMALIEAGRPQEALEAFEAAKERLGPRPDLEHNRALALAHLGRREEAAGIFSQLADDPTLPTALRAKSAYDLGNVHAAGSQRKEALAAYRQALTLDPQDPDARHNFEVLLRNLPPPQELPPDAGPREPSPDGGNPDAGQDAGSDAGEDGGQDAGADGGQDGGQDDGGQDGGQDEGGEDGGQGDGGEDRDAGAPSDGGGQDAGADGGQDDGGTPGEDGVQDGGQDAGADAGQPGGPDGGEQDGGEGSDGERADAGADAGSDAGAAPEAGAQGAPQDEGVDPEALSEQEANQLLDAMKQNEKNLQLWRFQGKKRPRNADQKDW